MNPYKETVDWLDRRIGIRALLHQQLTGYLLPRNINIWYTMGAVLMAMFGLQFLTGILLLVYYVPDTEKAFASVTMIMNEVPYGWLIRYLHVVGSNLIIVFLLLHMLSVLYMGSYKRPRELTWVSGFILFNLGLVFCLTGYLLPWSQLSFWATTVATDAAGAIPIVGDFLIEFLRGGPSVGEATLGRFFALHVMGLPMAFLALVGFHLFCVRRIGISAPPFGEEYQPKLTYGFGHEEHPNGVPFHPHYTVKDLAVVFFALALLVAITFYAPWLFIPLDALTPADPFTTPEHIKPEWYFLWAYQTLKIFPSEFLGLAAQGAAMGFLAMLPFIDRGPERRPVKRPIFISLYLLGILLFVGLSMWGHYS
ncbi:ubiquinol-cytochrome c reductase cytochrome b subunit [Malonomonas rubra DSM 5091]|uniref:Ubiquinol-cytochrome c reductase cytochrome b subunit n=1 Tax=Malonomonas rubra DSM 5091 TaxID=1122189 RepID=A0A1M6LZ15_MALRU|nr:cytochrome bc complex cytochrome b subunit [Malonomonas rubra]SHJ76444.1 ubiquinol-cytochrome c reductase cytochrome b subunit [Malonomonas rubra DSM 5091]